MNKLLILCAVMVFGMFAWVDAEAKKPQVKYCKDYESGRIVIVEAGFPCPSGFVEL